MELGHLPVCFAVFYYYYAERYSTCILLLRNCFVVEG